MGEKHSEQADEFYFILTVGSDSLFSSLCESITSFSKASLLFFLLFSNCYGDHIWKKNLSCDSISVDEISFESSRSLLWTFNNEKQHCFPVGLLEIWSHGVDFITMSWRILIPFFHKCNRRSSIKVWPSVCLSACLSLHMNLQKRYTRLQGIRAHQSCELFNLINEEAGMVANANYQLWGIISL